jgi:hypothetical protein
MNGGAMNSIDLLRRLEPAVRPHAPPIAPQSPGLFDAQPFEALLAQAFAGEMRSGRAVIDHPSGLEPPLERAQLERLALAADRAEAAGARRALMMIDGRALVLDVESRAIAAELSDRSPATVLSVDAAMLVPGVQGGGMSFGGGPPFAGINDLTAARMASASIAAISRR